MGPSTSMKRTRSPSPEKPILPSFATFTGAVSEHRGGMIFAAQAAAQNAKRKAVLDPIPMFRQCFAEQQAQELMQRAAIAASYPLSDSASVRAVPAFANTATDRTTAVHASIGTPSAPHPKQSQSKKRTSVSENLRDDFMSMVNTLHFAPSCRTFFVAQQLFDLAD